jgi:hypothetical protein
VEEEPRIDWELVSSLILVLMRTDAKLDQLIDLLGAEDDGEEEETDA